MPATNVVLVVALLTIAACSGGGRSASSAASLNSAAIVDGNGQTGVVGTELALPLTVKLTSSSGQAMAGAIVNFVVTSGGRWGRPRVHRPWGSEP